MSSPVGTKAVSVESKNNVRISPLAGQPAPEEMLVDGDALAAELQNDGAKSFVKSWSELMAVITSKSAALKVALAAR